MKTIFVDKVCKNYPNNQGFRTVLNEVCLSVNEGEFVSIMGPSGSGKSTLVNILGCLDRPSSGYYELCGRNTSELSASELAYVRSRIIGFVFQSFNLLPKCSVIENVTLPLMYSGCPKIDREQHAVKALLSVGLDPPLFDQKSSLLSGGQMQRVAVARAIVNDPSIIIADEPTGNLDDDSSAVIMEAFSRLCELGKTLVLITHDQRLSLLADRVYALSSGSLVEK